MQNPDNSQRPDLIVVGGGIFGLWAARHAIKRGERVLVLDKRRIGDGASGGFLGALMPHMPDTWNAKKQLQYDALSSMAKAVAELEQDTGMDCGYRRCGRLMPLTHERMPEVAQKRIAGAKANWVDNNGSQQFHFEMIEPSLKGTLAEGWLNDNMTPFGATYDDLSARINPRKYLEALASFVCAPSHGLGKIWEYHDVVGVKAVQNSAAVILKDGSKISGGKVLIANGWEAYSLLADLKGTCQSRALTGRGVKGQAVLVEYGHQDDRPIIYDDGSYIVPHQENRVAIGSTSSDNWMPNGVAAQVVSKGSVHFDSPFADHPEYPASVEPVVNRLGYEDGPLPNFVEMPVLAKNALSNGLSLATESFAGSLGVRDSLSQKLISAAISSFDHTNMRFYDKALQLCPHLTQAPIIERWANVRPRNTVPDLETGKVGTDPIFGSLDGAETIKIAIGGFKISLGLAHLSFFSEP